MADQPQRAQGSAPGSSSDPIQRATDHDSEQVPQHWLLEPGHIHLAANVDRLAGDVELITLLGLNGFIGRDWDYFATELAKYGMAVIGGWLHSGTIFQRVKSRGLGGLPRLDAPISDDDIEGLRDETVAKALARFRSDVLMKGKWDPTRGATLRTFFIGQCLIQFANVYRAWYVDHKRSVRTYLTEHLAELDAALGQAHCNVEEEVVTATVLTEALSQVKDPRARTAFELYGLGHTQVEIAEMLRITPKAVERMMSNERERQRKRRAG